MVRERLRAFQARCEQRVQTKMGQAREDCEQQLAAQKASLLRMFNGEVRVLRDTCEDLRGVLLFKERIIKKLVGLVFKQEQELYRKKQTQ